MMIIVMTGLSRMRGKKTTIDRIGTNGVYILWLFTFSDYNLSSIFYFSILGLFILLPDAIIQSSSRTSIDRSNDLAIWYDDTDLAQLRFLVTSRV